MNKVEINGIYYNLNECEKTAQVTRDPDKYSGAVSIPETVSYNGKTYTVTSIGDWAFYECSGLTSVNIPDSVTEIGKEVFANCYRLDSINVEAANTIYDSRNNCNAIIETATNTLVTGCKNTTIPNSVTSIGRSAFAGCSGLTSVNIPDSVTSIGDSVFSRCSGLTSINVETGNTIYDSRNNCNAIIETETNTLVAGCKNTTIPNSVTRIGDWAFSDCTGLTSVNIPYSVTRIGERAFAFCSGLTSINVETGNTIYDSRNNCNAIIETETNTLVAGCKNTTIPNSVTRIRERAFEGCEELTSINIPNSVTRIGEKAFAFCSGLTSINVETGNTIYDSRNNCDAIIKTATNTLVTGCKNTTIPNSVTKIGDDAFRACHGLTDVNIPDSVTRIGERAFEFCSGLTSITIPNSVTNIGHKAFADCKRLTDVYCYAENMPSTERIVFNNSDIRKATLHVPAASIEQYKTTKPWSNFGTIVAIDNTETQASKPASKAWAAIIKAGMKAWAAIIKAGTKAIKVLKK